MDKPSKNLLTKKAKQILMTSLSCIVLAALFTGITYEITKHKVTVNVDGKVSQYTTHAKTVADLFDQEGIHPDQHDLIKPGENAPITNNLKIKVKTAHHVFASFNHDTKGYWTTASTVGAFLANHKIKVQEHDKVLPAVDSPIKNKMSISYASSFKVPLTIGRNKNQVWTTSTTVADFLKKHNIQLGKYDKVKPAVNKPVSEGTAITVTRIKKAIDVVEEPVAFDTITRSDQSLPKGHKKVISSGKPGKEEKRYQITYKNGNKVSKKLISTKTLEPSQNQIVALGTKTYTVARSNDGQSQSIRMYSTAYTANCSGCSGITAYQHINLKENPGVKVIAVDPNVIPLGSKVYVPGYGYAIAADTGGAIHGNRIDVFIPSIGEARTWGARWITVRVLN